MHLLGAVQQAASAVELPVIADSFVRSSSTYWDTNYGAQTTLEVKTSPDDAFTRIAYLKFDLSTLTDVGTAILKVYGSTSTPFLTSVFGVNDDTWTETGITWNSRPPVSTAALSSVEINTAKYYDFDVSSFVQSQFAGDKIVTLVLRDDTGANLETAIFNSRENALNPPKLVIEQGTVAVPSQVTNLSATVVSFERIDLAWDVPANNGSAITGYKLYRQTNGGAFTLLVSPTGNTIMDGTVVASTTYGYKVSAVNAIGEGMQSTVVSATTPGAYAPKVILRSTTPNSTANNIQVTTGGYGWKQYTGVGSLDRNNHSGFVIEPFLRPEPELLPVNDSKTEVTDKGILSIVKSADRHVIFREIDINTSDTEVLEMSWWESSDIIRNSQVLIRVGANDWFISQEAFTTTVDLVTSANFATGAKKQTFIFDRGSTKWHRREMNLGSNHNLTNYPLPSTGLYEGNITAVGIYVDGQTGIKIANFTTVGKPIEVDSTFTPPTNPVISNITSTGFTATWTLATHPSGVRNYVPNLNGKNGGTSVSDTYTFTGLLPSTTYTFKVRAMSNNGTYSAYTTEITVTTVADTTTPSVPANLRQTAVAETSFSVAWDAATDNIGVSGYDLDINGTVTPLGNVLTYSKTNAVASTLYNVKVRAKDSAGNVSAYSTVLGVTTTNAAATVPVAPYIQAYSDGTDDVSSLGSINAAWTLPNDGGSVITGYIFEYRLVGGTYQAFSITGISNAHFNVRSLTPGNAYEIRCLAKNSVGNSAYSNVFGVTISNRILEMELKTAITEIHKDGGEVLNIDLINSFFSYNKTQLLYTSMQFAVAREWALKVVAGNLVKIYDLSPKKNHLHLVYSGGDGTLGTAVPSTIVDSNLGFNFAGDKFIKTETATVDGGDEFTLFAKVKNSAPDTQTLNYFFGTGNSSGQGGLAFLAGGNLSSIPAAIGVSHFGATVKSVRKTGIYNNAGDANIERTMAVSYNRIGTNKVYKDGVVQTTLTTNDLNETIGATTKITLGRRADEDSSGLDWDNLVSKTVYYNKQLTDTQVSNLGTL